MTDASRLTRKQLKERTRSRLLHSACKVFARRGLHQTSIDEVAADAGYTKGAFYANFQSKEDLFLAMLDERFAERLREIEQRSNSESEVEEQARAVGEDFGRYLAGDPDWQRLFFEFAAHAAREESFRRELVARYRGLREGIARILTRRAEELGVRLPLAEQKVALMTFAMANGLALERMLEPEAVSEELFGQMLAIFFAGLRTLAQEADSKPRKGNDENRAAPPC
jgi:AcrR family transcriptional regulator